MKIESFVEIVAAANITNFVADSFQERGGLALVGPPASLKTALVETLDLFPNALVLSDLTLKGATKLREDISNGKISTLAFTDFAKLYQRQGAAAANIEGYLRGLTGEGFRKANWEDQKMIVAPSRAFIVACMTPEFYQQNFGRWRNDGLARRILWSHYRLADPWVILNAIKNGERLNFSPKGMIARMPSAKNVITTKDVTPEDGDKLIRLLRYQVGMEIGLSLMRKILAVLTWKYDKQKAWEIVEDFAESLGKDGAELHINPEEIEVANCKE